MHLKEVRMENFKSFGHSLTVPIQRGFTAITGPNGAGKSNIADAILFVLGPRSARMIRAQKLTDLIYNGGKNEKGAKECEVSLVFDNADRMMPLDADEVVLTRRIRKAPKRGQPENYYSYFYVNGRAARLQEFVDLLQHARISADGYNIVTQGAVTQMVEMSTLERRQVLDSIAGITEFDGDIEKAEKKRAEVEANLERVNIILSEIRRNMEDLKRERDAALKYAELKKRHDELQAVFAFRRKEDIERQMADVNQEIASRQASRPELAQKLEAARQQLKEASKQKHAVESQLAELSGPEGERTRQEIEQMQAEAVRLEERMNYSRDEVKDLSEDRRVLSQEAAKVGKELHRLTEEAARVAKELEDASRTATAADKELRDIRDLIAQSDDGSLRINQELARLKADYEESTTRLHERRLEQDRFTEKQQVLETRLAELEDARSTCEFEIKDIEFQVEGLREDAQASGGSRKAAEREMLELRKRQAKVTQELNDLEAALRRLQREFHDLRAREEASATAGQGMTRAVDAVLQARAKGQLKGVHGTIADLGKAKESRHETALEVAAGGRMLSIVVENDAAAAAAIDYLKDRKLGRATFLPLNKMIPAKPRGKSLMAVKDDASLGFAADLVTFDKRYANAFSFVFGDTVVVKDLVAARRLMGGVRLVTLDGELVEASGAMIGGSLDRRNTVRFAGKDASRLVQVEAELQKATEHQEALTEELAAGRKRMSELEEAMVAGRAQESLELRLRDLETRKKEFLGKLKAMDTELEARRQELTGLQDSLANNESRIAELVTHLEALEAARKDKSKLLIKGTKKEWAERLTRLEDKHQSAQTQRLESESAVKTLESQMALLQERKTEVDQRLAKADASIKEHGKEAERAKAALKGIETRLAALTKAESQLSGKAKELHAKKDKLTEAVVGLNSRVDTLLSKIDTMDSLVVTAKNRLPTLEEALGEILVELTALGIQSPPEAAPNLTECKTELADVSSKMRALEPVNMLALDEFEKQQGREGELLEEVDRLNEQRENLIKVVEEIVARKKEGLMEVFEAVNANLKQVYARLTDGGEAFLELENPERPFEAGLLLKARPKGKKVLRLQSLSGGEKSMAALAFIFSIQEYEPSPFYVLDEVDMFLDGVNSELVATMVKQNSRQAQFIMISLRKVTLKEADHIFGVTMAGDGLSQMIANFDINLVTEEGDLITRDGASGSTLQVEKTGDGAKTIKDTVKDMVKVEVGK